MKCAWNELLQILPPELRSAADTLREANPQEIRMRLGQPAQIIYAKGTMICPSAVQSDQIAYVINAASRYSPWSAATVCDGFLTARGGHRIGICADAATEGEQVISLRGIRSLCIRIAADYPGIAKDIAACAGSVLLLGPPGSGKTTLLRDLIRQRSDRGKQSVAVVDSRRELFPSSGNEFCFPCGERTDVMSGCPKAKGISMVLRTMGPGCIAVDEITESEDCDALMQAGWCGVSVLATAHASSLADFYSRPLYRRLYESRLFDHIILMRPDKSWTMERMDYEHQMDRRNSDYPVLRRCRHLPGSRTPVPGAMHAADDFRL